MNTCDTCKHWGEAHEENLRWCEHPKVNYHASGEDVLTPVDAEYYAAAVATAPKFGCIHHERK